MKQKSSKASLGDVAKAAGISTVAACYALRNQPGVSKATRERVRRIAKQLGYAPDARIASWMATMREAKSKDLLPIAWLNTTREKDAWQRFKFMAPYLEGARERAMQLGYRLEELWLQEHGMTVARMNCILHQRGIEGVIVTYPARHLRLNWDHLASISLGGDMLAPRLHWVTSDAYYNLLLALKMAKRHGYRRIGVCLTEYFDRGSARSTRAAAHYFHTTAPKLEKVPPLFYPGENEVHWPVSKKQIAAWLSRYKPDVIICHSNYIVPCVEEIGYRVPEDVGVVHLATDDDVSDWAGITSNRRQIGATAAELVVSFMLSRQFGVPKIAMSTLIRGSWHPGLTLLIPKPDTSPRPRAQVLTPRA
ncbi:MAG: LacI family DNA-binding transcriptional regulator [Methylacidiphilales bacterium]|nr:LacI family DNA-binding transcriptional regulator [Candidatus Methylacidiphilales bacterium]